jgi:hypothetical protein
VSPKFLYAHNDSQYRSFKRLPPPLCGLAKSPKSTHAHWVVGKCRTFRNDRALSKLSHLPTTQCACADFWDFAKQRNGGGGREKDLLAFLISDQFSIFSLVIIMNRTIISNYWFVMG